MPETIYDVFSERMKNYERKDRFYLKSKLPMMARITYKEFHQFTRDMDRPIDNRLKECLDYATIQLCKTYTNVRIAFLHSAEIVFLFTDWAEGEETQMGFGYNTQKLQSLMAATHAVHFNKKFQELFQDDEKHVDKIGICDCRVWSVPFTEVNNTFVWRQKDAIRNATSMIVKTYFPDSKWLVKPVKERIELMQEAGFNYYNSNNVPLHLQRGRCVFSVGGEWVVGNNIPLFVNEPDFIECYLSDYFTREDVDIINSIMSSIRTRKSTAAAVNALDLFRLDELTGMYLRGWDVSGDLGADMPRYKKIFHELRLILSIDKKEKVKKDETE